MKISEESGAALALCEALAFWNRMLRDLPKEVLKQIREAGFILPAAPLHANSLRLTSSLVACSRAYTLNIKGESYEKS
jgi:hypothetical protein